MKYYSVKTELVSNPTGMATNALRVCMVCGTILSTRGGPGDYICEDCLHDLHTGKIARIVRKARREEI